MKAIQGSASCARDLLSGDISNHNDHIANRGYCDACHRCFFIKGHHTKESYEKAIRTRRPYL